DDLVGERRGPDAGEEQQRVAGEEESDQQTGLGEDDGQHADGPECRDQLGRVQGIEGEGVGEGENARTGLHGKSGYRPNLLGPGRSHRTLTTEPAYSALFLQRRITGGGRPVRTPGPKWRRPPRAPATAARRRRPGPRRPGPG